MPGEPGLRLPGIRFRDEGSPQDRARIHMGGVIDRHDVGIKATPPADGVVANEVHIDAELLLERVG